MKINNVTNFHFNNHGNYIEITAGEQPVNLTLSAPGEVMLNGEKVGASSVPETSEAPEASADEADVPVVEPEAEVPSAGAELVCPFTEAQQKACGIKVRPDVVLALMHALQPQYVQKVDWLSFYTALLCRGWVEENLAAWCRMVKDLFAVELDSRTLNADLRANGTDYTQWTDLDTRIVRRKRLATDFDTRLTEYFERKRMAILEEVRG